ncbi:hypothetical protein, partial [Halochromatium glycolicum]
RGEQASFIKALLCSEASMRPEIFNAGLRVLSAAISEDGGNCCAMAARLAVDRPGTLWLPVIAQAAARASQR